MKRRAKIIIFVLIGLILGIAPVLFSLYLSIQATQNESINDLKHATHLLRQNTESLFQKIDLDLDKINFIKAQCTTSNRLKLSQILLANPELSGGVIADLNGNIICSNYGFPKTIKKIPPIRHPSGLNIDSLSPLASFDEPSLIIAKRFGNRIIGILLLAKVMVNTLDTTISQQGLAAIVDTHKKKILAINKQNAKPKALALITSKSNQNIESPYPLSKLSTSQISYSSKVKNLTHVSVLLSLPINLVGHDLWHHIIILVSSGIFISIIILLTLYNFSRSDLSLKREIMRALKYNQFRVYYQPVINISNQQCVGVEALLRWDHKENGLILPDLFIKAAEKTELIIPITQWLVEHALNEMQEILNHDPNFHIAINLSSKHLQSSKIIQTTLDACQNNNIKPNQIIFEVTEREWVEVDDPKIVKIMKAIRQAEISLAIDDFGTGFANLNYLQNYHFNYLKIDKLFINAIGTGAITEHIVDSIIDMAQKLKLTVIAEGLENQSQELYLKAKNVALAQGWYYSKAINREQLEGFLSQYSVNVGKTQGS